MLETLERMPDDPILAVMSAYRADSDARKVDLGIGVYRDERGNTPILHCVHRAEQALLARETTKTYVGPTGNAAFNRAMEQQVFGAGHDALRAGRVCTIQSIGGSGALRLAAELIRAARPEAVLHVSAPSWANHVPLLSGAGVRLERYPYYDPSSGRVQFAAMLEALTALPAGSAVLLHASCHNPTGADLSESEWRALAELVQHRGLTPVIDMAYQGFAQSPEADAWPVRLFAAQVPELLVAVSCSKNFGLYRERTGVLHVVAPTEAGAASVLSHAVRIARRLYSMPADHGAAIVAEILASEALAAQWTHELTGMRERLTTLRARLAAALAAVCPRRDFGFVAAQRGMFSLLGLTSDEVRRLRSEHHIYMTDDSRCNLAGLRADNLDYFVRCIAQVAGA
jgi:aspartate aminotransferase